MLKNGIPLNPIHDDYFGNLIRNCEKFSSRYAKKTKNKKECTRRVRWKIISQNSSVVRTFEHENAKVS